MPKLRIGSVLALAALIGLAAGCGGGDEAPPATLIPSLAPPTIDTTTRTPLPTATALPPTWTAQPTLTAPPLRPTEIVTLDRPTATLVMLPTYTPTPIPPTPTPPGPVLIITADMINQAVRPTLEPAAGNLFDVSPTIGFQDGVLILSLNVLTTPGDLTTARAIVIQGAITAEEGRIKVTRVAAFFADTNAVYDTELVDNLLAAVQDALNTLIVQLYGGDGTQRFGIGEILIATTGLTVQTISLTP